MAKYKLTEKHRQLLQPWAQKWIDNAMSTKAMDDHDRHMMVEAIEGLYRAAGLRPPPRSRIVFVSSPFIARFAAGFAAFALADDQWRPVSAARGIFGATVTETRRAVDMAVCPESRRRVNAATNGVGASAADDWYWCDIDGMVALARELFGGRAKEALQSAYDAYTMHNGGNQWSGEPARLSFFFHVAKLDLPIYAQWIHYERAAIHGGPRYMHEKFCMVSDRPQLLQVDDENRPHAEGGPFCRWRDGTELYALHGVRVPGWLACTAAEEIDPRRFAAIENVEVRREFVRKVGIERIAQACGAKSLDRSDDGMYELLSVDLGGATGAWPYLKMRNPSIGVWHLEAVAKSCSTVQEAINWRASALRSHSGDWRPSVLT